MEITLTQEEIKSAIRSHVTSKGLCVRQDAEVEFNITRAGGTNVSAVLHVDLAVGEARKTIIDVACTSVDSNDFTDEKTVEGVSENSVSEEDEVTEESSSIFNSVG